MGKNGEKSYDVTLTALKEWFEEHPDILEPHLRRARELELEYEMHKQRVEEADRKAKEALLNGSRTTK